MRIRLTTIIPRPDGDPLRREREFTADKLTIGRNASADIYLHDKSVALDHAEIEQTADGIEIARLGQAEIAVNGHGMAKSRLSAGDQVQIGPYLLSIETAPEFDLAIAAERVGRNDDTGEVTRPPIKDFTELAPSMRKLSWATFLVAAVVALILPLAGSSMKVAPGTAPSGWAVTARLAWSSGAVSNVHAGAIADCRTCHSGPFQPVASETCLACHTTLKHHADPALFNVAAEGCTSCHTEHRGPVQPVRDDQASCAQCHGDIKGRWPQSKILNVTDFATNHPQFRVSVPVEPGSAKLQRVSLDDKPVNQSNMRFNHKIHLAERGILGPKGMTKLDCQSCHVPDASGRLMKPVVMEQSCIQCHTLGFDPKNPDWVLPHGNTKLVAETVIGLYSRIALGLQQAPATMPAAAPRGAQLGLPQAAPEPAPAPATPPTPDTINADIETQAATVLARIYSQTTCRYCHVVQPPPEGKPLEWSVAPVRQAVSVMPLSQFDHSKHVTTDCASCHDAKASETGTDLIMPSITECRTCHSGERPSFGKVASNCASCHEFHQNDRIKVIHEAQR